MVDTIVEATAHILAERGYAGTNTNVVAAHAGVSIGYVYQYFPNKDALIAALHEHHASQMYIIINRVLDAANPENLEDHITARVKALLAAHNMRRSCTRYWKKSSPSLIRAKKTVLSTRVFSSVSIICWRPIVTRSHSPTWVWQPGQYNKYWSR